MDSEWRRTRLLGVTLGALLLSAGATGCAQQNVSPGFDRHLGAGVSALQGGDLDAAETHISAAWDTADTFEQKRQVQSLVQLCAGARSMMDGDVAEARRQWAAIRDPHLNQQVRRQASAVLDVDVPLEDTGILVEAEE